MRKLLILSLVIALVLMTMPARAVQISNDVGMYFYSENIPPTNGNYWYVCSAGSADGAGSDSYPGDNPRQPLATVDAAINKCTAGSTSYSGDVIVILPGHAETIDATTDLVPDVDGVTFIGLGKGDMRPTFSINGAAFDSSPAVTMAGEDLTWRNVIFTSPYAAEGTSTQEMIDLDGDDITFIDCDFTITDDATEDIIMADGDNTVDNLTLINCRFEGYSGGADSHHWLGCLPLPGGPGRTVGSGQSDT